jgi:predicted NAD-dependent protein-ADP-ribosyltransferase YbiA (DUF1768 family)
MVRTGAELLESPSRIISGIRTDGRGDNCLGAALGEVVREFLSFLGGFEG